LTKNYKARLNEVATSGGGSILLSLSLFVILLAFFIVLNAISSFSEPKVNAAFESLDVVFSPNIIPSEFQEETQAENQETENGEGDSLEDMQGILRSVLPGLDMDLDETPNGGQVMAVRMKKGQFERLTPQLIPLFVRILNIKDGVGEYDLSFSSYVRDTLSKSAGKSFDVLVGYKTDLIAKSVSPSRILLSVEDGNPAFLIFKFEKGLSQ
jgi:hypothetical protein